MVIGPFFGLWATFVTFRVLWGVVLVDLLVLCFVSLVVVLASVVGIVGCRFRC